MGRALDQPDFAALPYEDRLARLLERGVGLWDVVARAERLGSLDANIRAVEHSDLAGLIGRLPRLQAVAFNGGTAAKIGVRQLGRLAARLTVIRLPSSSPAHAGKPFETKAQEWLALRPFLAPTRGG